MKPVVTLFLLLATFSTVYTQNIGINKDNPEHTLDVRSTNNIDAAGINISNQDKSKYVRIFSGSNTFPDPSVTWSPDYNMRFATFDDATNAFSEYMRISSTGDVGIGILDPQARLDIKGGDWNLGAGNPGDLRIGTNDHNFRIGIATGGGGAGVTRMFTNSNELLIGTNDSPVLKLGNDGSLSAPNMTNANITNTGNKSLITKEYADANYAPVASNIKEIVIPAASFVPSNNFFTFALLNGVGTTIDDKEIYASVILPSGATITSISAYMVDETSTNYIFSLITKDITVNNSEAALFTLQTNGTGNQVLSHTDPISIVSNTAYYVRIGTFGADEWGGTDGVKGIKIVYVEN